MDIRIRMGLGLGLGLGLGSGGKASQLLWVMRSTNHNARILGPPSCSKQQPQPNGANNNGGEKAPSDWDEAWSSFRKRGKKTPFSQFSPNKYVTWNPKFSNYPLSEEVDPIKRAERSNLMFWTGPGFTLVGAIIIVTFLLIYTILSPVK